MGSPLGFGTRQPSQDLPASELSIIARFFGVSVYICKVYETGEVMGKPYIAMQPVDGLPLDKAARNLTLAEKTQVIASAARALHAAHEQGIIHRDLDA